MERITQLIRERKLKLIEVSLLETINQDREDETEDSMEFLDASIADSALLEPFSVAGPYVDGKYKVISGARRLHAIMLRYDGNLKVPCYVVGDGKLSEDTLLRMRMECHISVKLADLKNARFTYCEMLAKEYGTGPELINQMSGLCGCTERYCRQYRDVLVNGSQYLKDILIHKNALRVGEAASIANAAPNDEELQKRLVKDLFEKRNMKKELFAQKIGQKIEVDDDDKADRRDSKDERKEGTPASNDVEEIYQKDDVSNAIYYMLRVCAKDTIKPEKKEELCNLCKMLIEKLEVL